MTKTAHLQTKPATPKPTISLSRPSILQRTCACGGVPGLTGECEACSSQQLSRSPGATHPSTLADRASNDHATAQSQQSPLPGFSFGKLAIAGLVDTVLSVKGKQAKNQFPPLKQL